MSKPNSTGPDFVKEEKERLKHWYKTGIVEKYLKKNNDSKQTFSFLDGPITANNPMGVHHAWGRTYKDIFQRYHNMKGFRQRFQNGFDCQGLWVEVEVEKELNLKNKRDIENIVPGDKQASVAKFVQLCKDRVKKYAAIQTDQSKRLGYFMDWDNSYFTMSDENNYMIWHFLKSCYEYGWIYKGHDCVPWCPRCETAISQHEMLTEDYRELVHESVYFTLPLKNSEKLKDTSLLIWTTTPWTIPANVAVAVNPKFKYNIWENRHTKKRIIFIGKDENGNVPTRMLKKKELNVQEYVFNSLEDASSFVVKKTISGSDLLGLSYDGPFDDLQLVKKAQQDNPQTFHTVVDGSDIVVSTEGTGLLHVAPGAGVEDYKLAKEKNLPVISPINDRAEYISGMGFISGKNAKKHPELIIEYLKEEKNKRFFFKTHMFSHRYPACWRCKTELVWKVADEWYIAMDKAQNSKSKCQNEDVGCDKKNCHCQHSKTNEQPATSNKQQTFRQMMIEVAKEIKWMPDFGLERELDWLKNMSDWLISKKNRYWGLALPIYECSKCHAFEVLGSKEELKERAVEGWDEFKDKSPHKPWIDQIKIICKKCGEVVSRVEDVGNPWLDAGIVPFATISKDNDGKPLYKYDRKAWEEWFPADFITESFPGQFKNWFYALIAMSAALENRAPFKRVLGFATLLAEDGRPMHKSWGNSIEFNVAADEIGVDVMRWMYARQNPSENMLFGYKNANLVRRQFLLMLYNIYKYYREYAVLDQFESIKSESDQSGQKLHILDNWARARLQESIATCERAMADWDLRRFTETIELFIQDISKWYIRRSRDRVWVNSDDKLDKKSFYSTLKYILITLSQLIAPIAPFMSDQIYTELTNEISVHLGRWPQSASYDRDLIFDMTLTREIAEAGNRARKEHGIKVRQPLLSAMVFLPKGNNFKKSANKSAYLDILSSELNVRRIDVKISDKKELIVQFDTKLTDELKKEGEIRELIREVQEIRKKSGLKPQQKIILKVPRIDQKYHSILKRHLMATEITHNEEIEVIPQK